MTVILAVDAAWTNHNPSGIALVGGRKGSWRAYCVAPNYDSFLDFAITPSIDWEAATFSGSEPNITRLLGAARSICNEDVDLVVIDMPLSTVPITGRRKADDSVSRSFGGFGCSTHSPTAKRPGQLSINMLRELTKAGYPIATAAGKSGVLKRTVETYPHPALLKLLRWDYRVPYKVSKSSDYWPGAHIGERIERLLTELTRIYQALSKTFCEIGLDLPRATNVTTLASLKRYEDALDALVCAWVGVMYAKSRVEPYGDSTAAIWLPVESD